MITLFDSQNGCIVSRKFVESLEGRDGLHRLTKSYLMRTLDRLTVEKLLREIKASAPDCKEVRIRVVVEALP